MLRLLNLEKKSMCYKVVREALKEQCRSHRDKFVLIFLSWSVNGKANPDGYCWPSHSQIADGTQMSVSSVQRALKHLEADGKIEIHPPLGDVRSCTYLVKCAARVIDRERAEPVDNFTIDYERTGPFALN